MHQESVEEKWDLIIEPETKLFNLHLKEIWRYRDLLLLLVRRDFVAFYKQTIFGPIWFFIQPLFTTIIYTFVFSRMAGLSTEGVPPALFYIAGTIAWNYFSECLVKTSTVFRDNATMFGKVYFPRLIMPVSIVISNLVKFAVQFILFGVMLAWYVAKGTPGLGLNAYALLFPVIILLMAMQGLGWGLLVTAMTTKYRDLAFLVSFGVQLLMYATPVIYPISSVPPALQKWLGFNPLTGLVETFRHGFLGSGHFYQGYFLYSVIFSIVILLLGLFTFNKVEKNFVDTV